MLALTLVATPALAADDKAADVTDMAALRTAVKTDKKALVEATLKLTPAEAKKFWPIYDAYQRNLDMTNRQRVVIVEALIVRDKPMTDLYARNLANELLLADESEIKARRTMQTKVLKAVPAKKAARYIQLESKIRATVQYDIAQTIPLIN
jgi:Spy/CpxP family protein refolding chaperone